MIGWTLPCEHCEFVINVHRDGNGYAPRAGEQAFEMMQRHIAEAHPNQEEE